MTMHHSGGMGAYMDPLNVDDMSPDEINYDIPESVMNYQGFYLPMEYVKHYT